MVKFIIKYLADDFRTTGYEQQKERPRQLANVVDRVDIPVSEPSRPEPRPAGQRSGGRLGAPSAADTGFGADQPGRSAGPGRGGGKKKDKDDAPDRRLARGGGRRGDRENATQSDMLLQANKMIALSKMAAGVAHEVNNPLASIAESAGWMKDLLETEEIQNSENVQEFRESIDKIEQHVVRARKVIQNLLGFARRMEPAKEKISINELLDETIGFLDNEARYVNISMEKNYADDVPVITSDLSQIQQVILNLLNNAIDAIGKGGVITVSSRYLPKTEQVEISVADTGKGMSEAEMSKIFDPFFTTKGVGKGTGLGLSISYSIIEKLGGKISVQSELGKGTTFTLTLPKN